MAAHILERLPSSSRSRFLGTRIKAERIGLLGFGLSEGEGGLLPSRGSRAGGVQQPAASKAAGESQQHITAERDAPL